MVIKICDTKVRSRVSCVKWVYFRELFAIATVVVVVAVA